MGTISFFTTTTCPQYWQAYPEAEGRLLVGGRPGVQVGAPLTDREDRGHVHSVNVTVTPASRNIAAASGSNLSAADPGARMSTTTTADAGSGLLFEQELVCRATLPSPGGDGYPLGSVAAFDTASCPPGWAPFAASDGRTLVHRPGGAAVGTALLDQELRQHTHAFSAVTPASLVGFTGATGGGNPLADGAAISITGTTEPAWDGVPYLQLLHCTKVSAPNAAALPAGTLAFNTNTACPAGWSDAPVQDRYLVGAPGGVNVGALFGGAQDHLLSGTVTFPGKGIALAAGTSASGYRAAGMATFTGSTLDGGVAFPRLELRLCTK